MFENNGHIYVYSPGAGTDNLLGTIVFQKCYLDYFVFFPIKFPCNSFFPFKTQATKFNPAVK